MCGIAGFWSEDPPSDARTILERMTDAVRHRGPDDSGFYSDGPMLLGFRRLSIIDLQSGHQPMRNEDGAVCIVFNGEIFNHASLRPILEKAGHRYATRCDTETILHAYEEYGVDCVNHFRGMFSFALWDRRTHTLFCARDRLGIKPFYYFWDGRTFAFASEIKALLQHPEISARLNEAAIPEYLAFGYTSSDATLFAGIRKLMPGHRLILKRSGDGRWALEFNQYWDIPDSTPHQDGDERQWIDECRRRLEETVRMRLMSDVPLGVFLSGGVDSSAITALVARMVSGPVSTFAVGYPEGEYSELGYARRVADWIGTRHQEVTVGREDFFNALPELIWHEDEPITWPSSVSLYFVSRLASQRVKVVLTGEGSDELFAGYARYRFFLRDRKWGGWYGAMPQGFRRAIRDRIASSALLSAAFRRKLQHTLLGRGESFESLYLDNFCCAFPGPPSAYESYLRYWNKPGVERMSLLSRLLYADQKTYMVELLMKQDQMSMANSIESRVPFLDHPLVEFAARTPDRLKLRGGTGKYILKQAVKDLLPPEITQRKKMGFPTPLRQWLLDPRSEALYAMLLDPEGIVSSCVDRSQLERLLERQRTGVEDATDRVWRLLNLQLWGDIFLLKNRDPKEGFARAAAGS